ncbi:alcohol dehydrogenase catalytic domain-containing protein [Sinomonas atrocyanea]|uniref:alcohol dehydrogenase catalytic domain-containing protein n=1 Tax=Sinomonas atrocyanea TaxID=37927 RepID=UPI00278A0D58|nr:zinc-binding dehydrogenase [Sinomonas atrocyanea]MDQ0259485.1 alcohol dehydrogenase [Sinomonas atrocyanea]MDR6623373.1 alcohol dehydrogenase [Sinomonas atrocyanea]
MSLMQAARLHEVGKPFQIDQIEKPAPGPNDVIVEVKACNVVPNLRNVITTYPEWFPFLPLPKLPAIYGLDAAGVVSAVGSQVRNVKPGDRVYVNPGRDSGDSHASRRGERINDPAYTFQGYFGFGPGSQEIFEDYPHGGFCEFMKAPADGVVVLPESISFEEACRFGYLGTSYSALKKAGAGAGMSVLVHGGTGTLGLGAVLNALGMGATKVFAVARDRELLERVRQLDPRRVHTLSYGDEPEGDWVRRHTGGLGADIFVDAIGPGAPKETTLSGIESLRRGGRMASIGGMSEELPVEMFRLMCFQISIIGSLWFTVGDAQDMAEMAAAGTLDLSVFEHEVYPLSEVNEALDAVEKRKGGFTNVVVTPGS